MAYDQDKDKQLFSKSIETEEDEMKLTVSVYSYNDGPGKLQISREKSNADGEWMFCKLGRMLKNEVKAILPLIEEAMTKFPKKEKADGESKKKKQTREEDED